MKVDMNSVLSGDISERIQAVEKCTEVKFPDNYIDFIKQYNIGVPITNKFELGNNTYVIERFFGFVNEYKTSHLIIYDIAYVTSQVSARLTDDPYSYGEKVIPIASLSKGDYLCLDYTEDEKNPCVCIWDHVKSDEYEPVTYKVTDSFSEFIEMLV